MIFYILLTLFILSGVAIVTLIALKAFEVKRVETLWIFAFRHRGDYFARKHTHKFRKWLRSQMLAGEEWIISLGPKLRDFIVRVYEFIRHRSDKWVDKLKRGGSGKVNNGNGKKSEYLSSVEGYKEKDKNHPS